MITCIVIDDEPLAQEDLVEKIGKINDLELLGVFYSPLEAMELIRTGKVDLVFSDIQMPEISGVSFLKSLKKSPLFIFVTGDPNYAIESFELDVVDYVLKPFGLERLLKAVNKVRALLEMRKTNIPDRDFLIIKDRNANIIMPYNEIFFIKSDKDYCKIATMDKTFIICKRLTEIVDALSSAKQFFRVQKSYLVNLDFAKTVNGNVIEMRGNIEDIPIGGQYKAELYKRLGISGTD